MKTNIRADDEFDNSTDGVLFMINVPRLKTRLGWDLQLLQNLPHQTNLYDGHDAVMPKLATILSSGSPIALALLSFAMFIAGCHGKLPFFLDLCLEVARSEDW